MDIITITTKSALLDHRSAIETLFYESFGQRDLGEVWDWAYQRNPSGDPIVTLCYEDNKLVGHYAIVPMPLSTSAVRKNSYISMTTMVAESHRRFGLFTLLAAENYDKAAHLGVDFVFGFPNAQSTPGFRNRLKWTLPEPDHVVTVDKPTLCALAIAGKLDKTDRLSLDLSDPTMREWRLSRPGGNYTFENGLAYKHHGNVLDLLWWESPENIQHLPDSTQINLLVDASAGLAPSRRFEYQFGGKALLSEFNAAFVNREMAISDLF